MLLSEVHGPLLLHVLEADVAGRDDTRRHGRDLGFVEQRRAIRPATMMPLNHRSMMNVVPIAARQSEKGARIMVPKLVMTSPTMCVNSASAVTP